MKSDTPPDTLRELLDYDPATGTLTWRYRDASWFVNAWTHASWNSRFAGKPALAYRDAHGYPVGIILGKTYKAHRVAWAHYYGAWPKADLDHINHDRADNRIANLREATGADNSRNASKRVDNASGATGVSWDKGTGKWRAYISDAGRVRYIGIFRELEEAIAARAAESAKCGYHENHGA